jgi:hypothetical protein
LFTLGIGVAVTPCRLVERYQRFRASPSLDMEYCNVGNILQCCMVGGMCHTAQLAAMKRTDSNGVIL